MAKEKIKVAMIGGGLNSAIGRVHEISLKMDNMYELKAGCFSRDENINIDSASAFGVDHSNIFNSPEALVKNMKEKIDALVIATPIESHFKYINLAIDNGLDVISDKPLLSNVKECNLLSKKLTSSSNNVYSIFNYTGYPAIREIKELVLNEELGHIFKVMIEMPQDSYLRLKNQKALSLIQKWRLHDGEIDCLTLDLFVHIHSLIAFILDNPKPVELQSWARSIANASKGLIDEVDSIILYENDLHVNSWYGKAALGYRNGLKIRIFGSKGSVKWVQEDPEKIILSDKNGDIKIIDRISRNSLVTTKERYNRFKAGHPSGFIEAFTNYYTDIAHSIINQVPHRNIISTDVALQGIRLASALRESSKNNIKISIKE